jgi:hypothetical protein
VGPEILPECSKNPTPEEKRAIRRRERASAGVPAPSRIDWPERMGPENNDKTVKQQKILNPLKLWNMGISFFLFYNGEYNSVPRERQHDGKTVFFDSPGFPAKTPPPL